MQVLSLTKVRKRKKSCTIHHINKLCVPLYSDLVTSALTTVSLSLSTNTYGKTYILYTNKLKYGNVVVSVKPTKLRTCRINLYKDEANAIIN